MQEIIEKIANTIDKKKVQSLCKKILKKCNLKAQGDLSNVVNLAVWLYIYGYLEEAVEICDIIGDLEFTGNYTLWDYTDIVLCLKARIMREQENYDGRDMILQKVNEHRHPELYPNLVDWYRVTVNENIKSDDEYHPKKIYDGWRIIKLKFAIRYLEAGGHPISDEEFENDIQEIMYLLKQVK